MMSIKKELYEICGKNQQVAESIAGLFLKNDILFCCEEAFLECHYLLIKEAFKEEKGVTIGFAYTRKAFDGKQSYGDFYLEVPKNIQEIYTIPLPALERPVPKIKFS